MAVPRFPSTAQLVAIGWVAIIWGWSLYYVGRFDQGPGYSTMGLLYSIPCLMLMIVYGVYRREFLVGAGGLLGYAVLLVASILLFQVSASTGDAAGYMRFFLLVALWGGSAVSILVAAACKG